MAQNSILSLNAKLYHADTLLDGSTNTPDTATWSEIDNAKDVTLNTETDEADVTTRGSGGWKQTRATLRDASIEFQMLWRPGDAAFTALRDAWLNSTEIAMAAMDGKIETSGNQGLASNFSVSNFTRNEALSDAVMVDVTVKPSSRTQWYEVAGT